MPWWCQAINRHLAISLGYILIYRVVIVVIVVSAAAMSVVFWACYYVIIVSYDIAAVTGPILYG